MLSTTSLHLFEALRHASFPMGICQPRRRDLARRPRPIVPLLAMLFFALCLLPCIVSQDTASSPSRSISASSSASSPSITPSTATTTSLSTLPTTVSLPALNTTLPTYRIDLPTVTALYITLNICSLGSNNSIRPQAILSTSSPPNFALGRSVADSSSGGALLPNRISREGDTWRLEWDLGFANWTHSETSTEISPSLLVGLGIGTDGLADPSVVLDGNGNVIVQLGVSTTAPISSLSPSALLLGDTTQNSVLLLSPLLLEAAQTQPTYPNYTLPGSQLVLGSYPESTSQPNLTTLSPNLQLVIVPTGSSPTNDGLDNSLCAVRNANTSTGFVANTNNMLVNATTQWMAVGGVEGYRTMWVVGDLVTQTNYTAWIVDNQGGMSRPIWFSTKESSFPCQLVMPSAICPGIAYAAPLLANETTATLGGSTTAVPFPISSLPETLSDMLTTSLDHFSSSLLATACGRDLFSHVSSCLDCYNSYRDWLCRIAIPQCAGASSPDGSITPQTITRTTDEPRIDGLDVPYAYTELKPCLSTCNRADRTCPVFLGFRCPRRTVTAGTAYGFLGLEKETGDGSEQTGPPALDRWGNRWCNG